jgi:alpha-galactosidase
MRLRIEPDHWRIGREKAKRVGVENKNVPSRLTPDEQYTHVSLWCLLSAPLFIGGDLDLDPFTLNLLTNDEVLAVDQDALGKQAARISQNGSAEVWAKEMEDGSRAIGLFNRGNEPQHITASWNKLHLAGPQIVRDLWRQKDIGTFADHFDALIPSHGVLLISARSVSNP